MSQRLFYVISLNHTKRRDAYITIWRPDDKGYAYPLSWSGRYTEDRIASMLGYYNSGHSAVAVPCDVLDAIAIAPKAGLIDGDAGPVIPNRAASWKAILANLIATPAHKPAPEYRGAPRIKESPQ